MRSSNPHRKLYRLAETHGGYFTTKQAQALGYTSSKRVYHVRTGNWIREHRGIYRLALFPQSERPDLTLWWLWSRDRTDRPQGVFSHQTALSLHELTDQMPASIDLTVPKGFRRSVPIPKVLRLHFDDVPPSFQETLHGVPVTNALRTILDLRREKELPRPILFSAYKDALRRGLITRSQVRQMESYPNWRDVIQSLESQER